MVATKTAGTNTNTSKPQNKWHWQICTQYFAWFACTCMQIKITELLREQSQCWFSCGRGAMWHSA